MNIKGRHFLTLLDYKTEELKEIIDLAIDMKSGKTVKNLPNKTLGMLFQKPSTRTRISFEVGMTQLGGHAIYLDFRTTQLGRGETISDTSKVLSRYCDILMARLYKQTDLVELANASSIPVINALTDLYHPCQTMADMMTVIEKRGKIKGLKVAFLGDCGFNMCNSTIIGFSKLGADVVAVCPDKDVYTPNPEILNAAKKQAAGNITVEHDPIRGVMNADIIYTDTWVSMGQEDAEQRIKDLRPYQVNEKLVSHASKDVLVMHCLPAHRGQEITDDVIDGPHSIVFDEAENRLHVQKAIMVSLMGV
ncbi:MAG: ornithine carbamoyltransferase [Candidatus Aenigmarchaeota archaeon]|nr:ornithine carbamoyltransferase [Candidatus Aenigmarchaeota archaeon]